VEITRKQNWKMYLKKITRKYDTVREKRKEK
jgi:hypothetical protein